MKFTSEDFMEWLGLQVGDKVKIADDIYKLYLTDLGNYYLNCTKYDEVMKMYSTKDMELIDLLDKDIEILPRPKRVGDLKCNYYKDCDNCPLIILFCDRQTDDEDTLYDVLNRWNNEYVNFDQEIYDLLKARLDKEVKEC